MHVHIVGICGTFMGGLAILARQLGYKVTGCDANVYPPMSTQLQAQSIDLITGFGKEQINLKPDLYIIGNVVSRGNELMEEILKQKLPYVSGPQWLFENILRNKWVLAVAGTHGKTTTATMLTWILEFSKLNPSYLIGGVPLNFKESSRLTDSQYFVIEADEYDTAFFDKRSKFLHYSPKTAILNNLEFDHADIFSSIEDIKKQFHYLVRTVPNDGQVIINQHVQALHETIAMGLWSDSTYFSDNPQTSSWAIKIDDSNKNHFEVIYQQETCGKITWDILGKHNQLNALAAIAASHHVGVDINIAIDALNNFGGVKRRMEVRGMVKNIIVYDDFAHHPTAIQTTIEGLRNKIGKNEKIIAVLEPRSNTMKMGAVKQMLPDSLTNADFSFVYDNNLGWNVDECFKVIEKKSKVVNNFDVLLQNIVKEANKYNFNNENQKCHILVMSNGGFNGIHQKILDKLAEIL